MRPKSEFMTTMLSSSFALAFELLSHSAVVSTSSYSSLRFECSIGLRPCDEADLRGKDDIVVEVTVEVFVSVSKEMASK
jgi:hypothetical protein